MDIIALVVYLVGMPIIFGLSLQTGLDQGIDDDLVLIVLFCSLLWPIVMLIFIGMWIARTLA